MRTVVISLYGGGARACAVPFFLAALLLLAPAAVAQEWARYLAGASQQELTFQDYKEAFEAYYEKHPVDLRLDKVEPVFEYGEREIATRRAIEEYKLFKRWEWFAEPRLYPSGRWDFEKIDAARARVREVDGELLLRQAEPNPLGLEFEDRAQIEDRAETEDSSEAEPVDLRAVDTAQLLKARKLKVLDKIIVFPLMPFWTSMGPSDAVGGTNMGRVNCIEFDPENPRTIYIGAPDGGVWKSTDGGATWVPKFDYEPTLSIGDIAIDPNDTQIVYAATGDSFGYGTPFWGGTYSVGVRKSTDGGTTWSATGLTWTVGQNRTIRRLAIHPKNGSILLAATSNGLYRTADAGASWTQIWAASTFDVEFQHDDGNTVYATTSQVLKSVDAGVSFTPLTASCSGSRYNIEIARSNPDVLYTLCTDATVQKSTNAGVTWTTTSSSGVTLYGYYDNVLAVSPVDADVVYVAGFNMKTTTDGGGSWSSVPTAGHVDNHALEFYPGTGRVILCGNDGGLFKTVDGGNNWSSLNQGLAITQYYRLGIAATDANIMIAGAQDNGNMKYSAGTWSNITNADGMDSFIDWSDSMVLYASIQYGSLHRSTDGGASFTGISTPSGGAWVTPWTQDPVTADTLYAGTDKVYKSTNQGTSWTAISGALSGVSTFTVLAVAPSNSRFIYAGDGNKLYKTTNGGTTWTDVSAGLPVASNYLTDAAVHSYAPGIVYVTFSGYNSGEKVYMSCDGGGSWSNISGTLPNMPVNTIVHQKTNNGLYIGTDAGVYYRNDHLTDWVPYKWGLPNVIVDDLEIHYGANKIRAATYGRGVWQASLLP